MSDALAEISARQRELDAEIAGAQDFSRLEQQLRHITDQIETVEGLEGSGIPKAKLNIAYIPISLKPSSQRDEQWVLDNYDYDRAATLLLYLPKRFARHEGPYLVSHGAPLADDSQGEFL